MTQIQLFVVVTAACIASGCNYNARQVRNSAGPLTDPGDAVLVRSKSSAPAEQMLADKADVGHGDESPSRLVRLASVTSMQATSNISTDADLEAATDQGTGTDADRSVWVTEQNSVPDIPSARSGMSLADFESLALANNPSIRELAATTQKAAGFRDQVGLQANPIFGYQGQQLADRNTDQHLAFFEQEFATGNKLQLNRRVLNEAVRAQSWELQAQKLRVATDVHLKFYEALAAQERIQLIAEFQSVTEKGIHVAKLRVRAAEGTRIDVLQATVQKNEIDLSLQQAEIQFVAAWRGLVALTGMTQLEPTQVIGDLPQQLEQKDWSSLRTSIVSSSPEYHAALTRIAQAKAQLLRHDVQAVPNVTVQFGAGVDNATNNGMMNVQIGAPIPVFNQNQGNICAAQAEYCRAALEAQRIEKSIEARLAVVSEEYDSALAAVLKYSQDILPNAVESLNLAEQAYEAGETSFVQVLVARRTYFDSNLQFIQAQRQLAQANAKIEGYVLTGGLDPVVDNSGDDSLRGLTFGQQ